MNLYTKIGLAARIQRRVFFSSAMRHRRDGCGCGWIDGRWTVASGSVKIEFVPNCSITDAAAPAVTETYCPYHKTSVRCALPGVFLNFSFIFQAESMIP